jgi:hypothetical protein
VAQRRRDVLTGAGWTVSVALALAACAPAAPRPLPAAAGCASRVQERVYFGLADDRGPIADADWQAFVERVVTPRFPAGLTVIAATGQWRDREGRVGRESSRIIEIVHDDTESAARLVGEIVAAYKRDFRQEAVLVVRAPVVACF